MGEKTTYLSIFDRYPLQHVNLYFSFLFRQLTDLGVKIAVWDINLEAAEAAVR